MFHIFQTEFREAKFDDDVYLRLVVIEVVDTNLKVEIHVNQVFNDEVTIQKWIVEFQQVKDFKFTVDYFEDVVLETNQHPLIYEYLEPTYELYFNYKPNNAHMIIGELLNRHQKVTDNWVEFSRYFNENLAWLLLQENGLLASGPEPIINHYVEILEKHHLKPSKIKVNDKREEVIVIILGNSYVVCEHVEFKRIG